MPGPVYIRGDRVDLHVVDESDLEYLQRLINEPEIWRSLFQVNPITMDEERSFYEDVVAADGEVHLLVCVDGEPVGMAGLSDLQPDWGVAELGYYVDPDAQGEGYATEAAGLLARYGFEQRRLAKLYAHALATNPASVRVLEKVGFEEEGRLRSEGFVDGERVDVLRFGLLAEEFGPDASR